jgi:hypothetical protein
MGRIVEEIAAAYFTIAWKKRKTEEKNPEYKQQALILI